MQKKYIYNSELKKLIEIATNRKNRNSNPQESETNQLFYWIIDKFAILINNSFSIEDSHTLDLKEDFFSSENNVFIVFNSFPYSDVYISEYVNVPDFYTIVEDLVLLLNTLDNINAYFTTPPNKDCGFELKIQLNIY